MPANASSWNSINQPIHHDNPDCEIGKQIAPENLRPGTGGKALCVDCARLNRIARESRG